MSLRHLSSSGYVTQRLLRRQRPPPELSVVRRFILCVLCRSLFSLRVKGFTPMQEADAPAFNDFNVALGKLLPSPRKLPRTRASQVQPLLRRRRLLPATSVSKNKNGSNA